MEPAWKRQRVAQIPSHTEDDDELELEPDELNERRDPAVQLARGRARAINTLKSKFEDIFAKYEKDFTGIGDEIDLSTGKVVVDNGHLSSLRDMKDWIVDEDEDEDEDEDGEDQDGGEDRGGEGREQVPTRTPLQPSEIEKSPVAADADGAALKNAWHVSGSNWTSHPALRDPQPLGSSRTQEIPLTKPVEAAFTDALEPSVSADPTWQAPELPRSDSFRNTLGAIGTSKGRHYGGGTPVATRTVLRSSLHAPVNSEADEVDDLQELPINASGTDDLGLPDGANLIVKSPLIKKKFPPVDSSPQDGGLIDLIQDVIENIPDTPHSIKAPRVAKSLSKPSPLAQEIQAQSSGKSSVRQSDAPLNSNREPPRKRGRKPKVPLELFPKDTTPKDPSTQSSWEHDDLKSYVDITHLGNVKTLGQALYIDIKARRDASKQTATADARSTTRHKDMHTKGIAMDPGVHEDLLVQEANIVNIGPVTARDKKAAVTTDVGQTPSRVGQPKPQERFTRNVADPDFYFSDEETLLSRRRPKTKSRSKPEKLTPPPPPPEAEPDTSAHNVVEEHDKVAAEIKQVALDQETASSFRRQLVNTGEPTEGVPAGYSMLAERSPTAVHISQPPIPECILECVADRFEAPPTLSSSEEMPLNGLKSLVHHKSGPYVQTLSERGSSDTIDSFSTEELLSPARQSKRDNFQSDPVDVAGVSAHRNTKVAVQIATERPAPDLQHELRGKKGRLNFKARELEDRDPSLRPHSERRRQLQRRLSNRFQPSTSSPAVTVAESDEQGRNATPACSECSKRKKQCDGRNPCSRCRVHGLSAADCIRAEPGIVAQRKKRTAQEASLVAETGRGKASRRGIAPQFPSPVVIEPHPPVTVISRPETPFSDPVAVEGLQLAATTPDQAVPRATQKATSIRPKSTGSKPKTPSSSFNTSLISLLSDSEDSEDEISFTHSDFTPSGHHRILVHRPVSQLPTTPQFSASSKKEKKKKKKKKRPATRLYGRPNSASSHKTSKAPHTPLSAGAGTGMGAATGTTAAHHRSSSRRLPRSVVRVVRRRDSDEDREGSVVQTPGGTKRRCGVEGYKCDRDFCFVCM